MSASPLPPPTLSTYGADENGLICAYGFAPDCAPQALDDVVQAEAWQRGGGAGFVWLHFNLSHTGAEAWLQRRGAMSENFFEALHDGSRATRIERDGMRLFAVINDVTFDFTFDASDVATLWLYVQADRVVSARARPLRAVDRLRTAIRRGDTLGSSIELLDHLLRDQADELQRIVRRAAERIDDIEDALLAGQHERHGTELARLRRLMVRLQRLLAPEPSALMRMLASPPAWMAADDLQGLHRAHEEFALVLRDIAALQERVKLMQDEAASRVAEQNTRSLFTLTMVTVLALPINLLAGLFGMNVGGIPLAGHAWGFWIMAALIALLTGAIAAFALGRIRPRQS